MMLTFLKIALRGWPNDSLPRHFPGQTKGQHPCHWGVHCCCPDPSFRSALNFKLRHYRTAFPDDHHPRHPPRQLCDRRRAGRQARGRRADRNLLRRRRRGGGVRAAGRALGCRAAFCRRAGPGAAARARHQCRERRDRRTLAFDTVEARDWVKASLEDLVPVPAGRFVVHGAHDREHVARQQACHRDRGGAGVRHRASRHHARLPAAARPCA